MITPWRRWPLVCHPEVALRVLPLQGSSWQTQARQKLWFLLLLNHFSLTAWSLSVNKVFGGCHGNVSIGKGTWTLHKQSASPVAEYVSSQEVSRPQCPRRGFGEMLYSLYNRDAIFPFSLNLLLAWAAVRGHWLWMTVYGRLIWSPN